MRITARILTRPALLMTPDLRFWNAVILDDEMKGPERLKNLQTLFRYVSSHKGFSLCLSHQNFFGLEAVIKKVSNIFVIWKPRNRDEIGRDRRKEIFDAVAHDEHDCICVDQ